MALLLMALLPAQAQKRWGVVPTVGLQLSQVRQHEVGSPLVSIKGGVLGRYRISKGDLGRIYLEGGVLISKRGFRGEEGVPIRSYQSRVLEVPLLLNFDINLTQQVNSFWRIGPYYSYAFVDAEGIDPNDYGIQVGVGAEYRRWVVALDGGFGLHDVNREEQGQAKQIHGYLSIGYRF